MNNKIADRLRTEPMSPGLLRDAINELDVMWSLLQQIPDSAMPRRDIFKLADQLVANDPNRGRLRSEETR